MTQIELFTELVLAVGAAFVGGLLARAARLPVLIGYILGGIAVAFIEPQIGTAERGLATVANLGVALLMFIIGVELSLPQFLGLGRTVITVAVLQMLLTIAVGTAMGVALGSDVLAALVLGFAMALSSTAVVLKSLEDHGQVNTLFGQVMLGILITQDLAVVLMLAMLPALDDLAAGRLPSLLVVIGRSVLFLAAAVLIASKVIPRVLNLIARAQSRELFALTVIALSFAAAFMTYKLGFSVALGAFLAGIIVGESEYTHQVFAEIAPVRDIFAAVFFVTIGATFRPAFFINNAAAIGITLAAVVAGKFVIVLLLLLIFGQHHKVAFLSGVGLAQMGEFSFLIAQDGLGTGAIPVGMFELIMSVTLLSIVLTPILIRTSPALYAKLMNFKWLARIGERALPPEGDVPRIMRDHIILLGFGNVGQLVGAGLHAHGVPYVVIDYDRDAIVRARSRGIPAIYGDAANPLVIKRADPKHAKAVVVALPDSLDTWMAVRHLREDYPSLPVIARAATEIDIGRLYAEGVEEVINPRYEAGLEILRHMLMMLRVPPEERESFIDRMRHWEPPHDMREPA